MPLARGIVIVSWPALMTVGLLALVAADVVYDDNPFGFLILGLLLSPIVIGAVLACLVLAYLHIKRKRAGLTAAYLVMPTAIAAFAFAPDALLGPLFRLNTHLKFERNRRVYEAEIARSPHPVGKRVVEFDWSGFAGNNTFLIYDESDALSREEKPENGHVSSRCIYRAAHYVGHYYFCNE